MVNNRSDYELDEVQAAKSVLIEIMHLLGRYRDAVILIGGWVPRILFPNARTPHIGSTDVDVLLNHNKIDADSYRTIGKLLSDRDYIQSKKQPFIYFKTVNSPSGRPIKVQVDFLAGEYQGTAQNRRTQKVQDIHPRKVRGGEIAFESTENATLNGRLPNGSTDEVSFITVTLSAFIILKSIALKDRIKEKDAWDIYYCLLQYGKNLDGLAREIKSLMENSIAKEAIKYLESAFLTIESNGPVMVADFEMLTGDERIMTIRDAYERVNTLIKYVHL